MSVTIGGFIPGFNYKLNITSISPKILSTASSGTATGTIIDANYTTTTYTGSFTGTQYNAQIVIQQTALFGVSPIVSLTTDNTGVATIDQFGNTNFNATGNFNIIPSTSTFSKFYGQNIPINLNNISGAAPPFSITTYSGLAANVSQHFLVIYNTNSNDSINLKNYYTGKRPLFSGVNTLGIACPSGQEVVSYFNFTGTIRQPIINYLTGVSGTKPIRYVIMMCDIPTRVSDTNSASVSYQLLNAYSQLGIRNGISYNNQNGHFSLGQYQQNTFLCSYINFGTYKDSTSYIDKICAGQTGLYLTGNGLNSGYYIEDAGGYGIALTYFSGRNYHPLINQFPSANAIYHGNPQGHITTGNNLAGYCSWGTDGGLGQLYANNGTIKWGQNNNWYLLLTVDSFNGQRSTYQGNFINWFSSGAFGGTGYNNCPVAAVGNVEEPYLGSSCLSGYFNLWQTGYPFIECAWQSFDTPYFVAFGDPFVHI